MGPAEVGEHGHPRVWEVVRGAKGAPGGADKDGGGTIWVAWFHSKSLSAAEMLRSFFFSTNFHLLLQITCLVFNTRGDKVLVVQHSFIQSHQRNLL